MGKDIAFKTEDGVTLREWHHVPGGRQGKAPTIVMAHGFSVVKEMYLDRFADAFAAAGVASVVFDNRNCGASDGAPRQEIDPWRQVRDYRDAITYAETLEETDAESIGIWGTSYSGGHVARRHTDDGARFGVLLPCASAGFRRCDVGRASDACHLRPAISDGLQDVAERPSGELA